MYEFSGRRVAAGDALFPGSATLPLTDRGDGVYPLSDGTGELRPFVVTLAVPAPVETKKHDTAASRQTVTRYRITNVDGREASDPYQVTETDT